MSYFFKNNRISESGYVLRFLMAVLTVQILLLLLIKLWPETAYEPEVFYVESPREQVLIDEIQITQQRSSPPPPPRPQLPQPVPSDEIIEIEIEFDVDLNLPDLPLLDPGFGTGITGSEARVVRNPQIPPTVVRIVEASAPEEVPDEIKGRLEMIVNFLVDENGEVEEVTIEEIRLYNDDGTFEGLTFVQYGLMDAVLTAAMQWRFRPARQDGERVKAFTRQRFNY